PDLNTLLGSLGQIIPRQLAQQHQLRQSSAKVVMDISRDSGSLLLEQIARFRLQRQLRQQPDAYHHSQTANGQHRDLKPSRLPEPQFDRPQRWQHGHAARQRVPRRDAKRADDPRGLPCWPSLFPTLPTLLALGNNTPAIIGIQFDYASVCQFSMKS